MVDILKLKKEQTELAKKVVLKDSFEEINLVAGADQVAFNDEIISCIVVCDYKTMKVVEEQYAVEKSTIPYIPGYLGYREVPVAIKAFHKLENKPDIVLFDANGILHPRRFGAASQFGLLTGIPTIGIAKKLLSGEKKDDFIIMEGEKRAFEIKTKDYSKPIYVSPGHLISLKKSIEVVKNCLKGNKLPEPLFLAHKYSNKVKNNLKEDA